jgi:hypothetical protein
MKLTVDVFGLDAATRSIVDRFSERRLNAAAATALTRTALDVKAAEVREMRRVFDRPTPYTLNSVYVKPATAAQLVADVWLKDDRAGSGTPATYFLGPEVRGGGRGAKGLEKALQAIGALPAGWLTVPAAGARLDAYGNVQRGQIIQILSQLRITLVAGYTRNMSFDARKQINAQRKAGGRYFVVRVGQRTRLPPGVYLREWFVRGVTPVFLFVSRANYQPRLDFDAVAQREAADRLPVHLIRAIEDQAQRLTGSAS